MAYGRETCVFFEILQPLCSRQYGDAFGSPAGGCQAVLGTTGTRKCYNTRFTCQDPANFNPSLPGSPTAQNLLTLRFSYPQEGLLAYGPLVPSLVSLETTAAQINLAAMDRNVSALGSREVVTVRFEDHKHSDHLVDPYRLERAAQVGSPTVGEEWNPYDRGTFWGKWLARNPYYSGVVRCRVREGFVGDALEDMRTRTYVIDRIEGPSDGVVTLVAKDLFSIIEAQKAVAPPASRGELTADLSAAHGVGSPTGTFSLSPTGIGDLDYPTSGSPATLYVAIGDEIIHCTRSGDTFTILERGALNTAAEDHDEEDLVQWVLAYVQELAVDIVHDLLLNYTSLTSDDLPKAQWDIAAAQLTALYTARIAKPTPVNDLVGELSEQAGFTVWPDVEQGLIQFAALRRSAPTVTVDDARWILDEPALELKRRSEKRASQVWVYYGQIDPTVDLDEERNYRSRIVVLPGEDLYGVPAIRQIFSRWIPQFGRNFAEETGERILAMFADPPIEARFSLDIGRDGELNLARFFSLETADIQDDTGDVSPVTMATTAIRRGENTLEIKAQQVTFAEDDDDAERVIFIENDSLNLNLRTLHDSLYEEPTSESPSLRVRFVVVNGTTVGSASTLNAAMVTGSWPAGVDLTLENHGRIQGMGGVGGNGGNLHYAMSLFTDNGTVGQSGGPALQATYSLILDNQDGEIWGGGGGGGGGGTGGSNNGPGVTDRAAGSSGGGGAGTNGGSAGTAGDYRDNNGGSDGNPGAAGTTDGGGSGGATVTVPGGTGGAGGNGGGPGEAGASGANGTSDGSPPAGTGAAGGAAGSAIVGISFVTLSSPSGDIRGAQV